jgi:hypothetical protein
MRRAITEVSIANLPYMGVDNMFGLVVAKQGYLLNLMQICSNEAKSIIRRPLVDFEWFSGG